MTDQHRSPRAAFPRALALMIARKADYMAKRFEDEALEQMTRAARQAMSRGESPDEIARQMGL